MTKTPSAVPSPSELFNSVIYGYDPVPSLYAESFYLYFRKFELECVAMTANMLNAGPEACGSMTSGGTESILMAVKAYRSV